MPPLQRADHHTCTWCSLVLRAQRRTQTNTIFNVPKLVRWIGGSSATAERRRMTTRGRVYLFQHRQRMEHLHRRTPIRMCPKHLTLLLDTGPSPASFCGTAKTRKHSEPSLRYVYPYMFDTLQHAGHCLRITSTTVVQLLDTPLREHPSSPPTARGRSLTRQNDPPTSRAQGPGAAILPKTVHVVQHLDMTPKRNMRRGASD